MLWLTYLRHTMTTKQLSDLRQFMTSRRSVIDQIYNFLVIKTHKT